MGFRVLAEQLVTHLQFLGLLINLNIDWPDTWRTLLSWVEIFNLDFDDLLVYFELDGFDFRSFFLVVSVILPLGLVIIILELFNPFYVVIWYASFVAALIALIVGLLGRFLPSVDYLPSVTALAGGRDEATAYIILGAIGMGCCLILLVLYRMTLKQTTAKDIKEDALRFDKNRSLKHLAFSVPCLLIGGILYFTGATQRTWFTPVVGALFVMGAAGLIYFFINLTNRGRKATYLVARFLKANTLKIVLFAITLTFIPILSYSLNMFMCVEYSCPAGTKFNPFVVRPAGNFTREPQFFCDPCVFDGACSINISTLCPAWKDRRLVKHPDISCTSGSHNYFIIAAALSALVFSIAVPLFTYLVVNLCTEQIVEKISVINGEGQPALEGDHLWLAKIYTSDAAPASLYRPFRYVARNYSLVQLLHKFVVVGMLILVSPFRSELAIVVTLVLHAIASFILFFQSPYLSRVEGGFANGLSVVSVINTIFGLVSLQQKGNVPSYTVSIFIALNGVIPVVVLMVVEVYVQFSAGREQEDRRKAIMKKAREAKEKWQAYLMKHSQEVHDAKEALDTGSQPPNASSPSAWNESRKHGPPPHVYELQQRLTTPRNQEEEYFARMERERLKAAAQKRQEENYFAQVALEGINKGNEKYKEEAYFAQMAVNRIETTDEENAVIDAKINADVAQLMTRFFMFMGLALFLAFGLTVLGHLRTPIDEFINASYGEEDIQKGYGGHPSWASFNSSCCCIQNSRPIESYNVTERWVCLAPQSAQLLGKTVTRGRVSAKNADSGLPIRPLCGKAFVPECVPVPGKAEVVCSPVPKGVTERALKRMW